MLKCLPQYPLVYLKNPLLEFGFTASACKYLRLHWSPQPPRDTKGLVFRERTLRTKTPSVSRNDKQIMKMKPIILHSNRLESTFKAALQCRRSAKCTSKIVLHAIGRSWETSRFVMVTLSLSSGCIKCWMSPLENNFESLMGSEHLNEEAKIIRR